MILCMIAVTKAHCLIQLYISKSSYSKIFNLFLCIKIVHKCVIIWGNVPHVVHRLNWVNSIGTKYTFQNEIIFEIVKTDYLEKNTFKVRKQHSTLSVVIHVFQNQYSKRVCTFIVIET